MDIFSQIASKIIKEQELIIGPLAWDEAKKVNGINVIDPKLGVVEISSTNSADTINSLVGKYENLFGRASKEACRDAVSSITAEMRREEIPSSLI